VLRLDGFCSASLFQHIDLAHRGPQKGNPNIRPPDKRFFSVYEQGIVAFCPGALRMTIVSS